MATKRIIDVEINDGAFQRFQAQFKAYQALLSGTGSQWAKVNAEINGSKESFKALVDAAGVRLARTRLIAAAEKEAANQLDRAAALTERQAISWTGMARNAGSFATHIADGTKQLLRWASLTGVISGVLGAGGLFGIDRLAASAGNQRRSALGLGVTPGQQSAFNLNYGRVVDPNAVLSGVNEALHDPTKAAALLNLGLNYQAEQQKGTAGASIDVLNAAKRLADQTPEGLAGTVFQSRGLSGLGLSLDDFLRLKNTPASELSEYGRNYQKDSRGLDLTSDQQKAWQDLQNQLDRAGREIERTFIVGLTPLAPEIKDLSTTFTDIVKDLLKSDGFKEGVKFVSTELHKFDDYLKTPQFKEDVDNFTEGVKRLAKDVRWALEKLGILTPAETPGGNDDRTRDPKVAEDVAGGGLLGWLLGGPLGAALGGAAGWAGGRLNQWSRDFDARHAGENPNAPNGVPRTGPLFGPQMLHQEAYRPGSDSLLSPASFSANSLVSGDQVSMAHDFFRSVGWSEAQTAGLLANIGTESGFRADAFNPAGGGQGAQGLFQWRGDRVSQFESLFGHSLRTASEAEQLMFAQWELTHTEKAVGDRLRAFGRTAGGAAAIVNEGYERSGTSSAGRSALAGQYAHQFKDRSVRVDIHNNTGGNAAVTASQLSV